MSVEQLLWFALGALSAGLVWSALVPAFWKRAVRLTRERLERALPLSLEEIVAERDRLRAAFVVEQRRLEQEAEAGRERLQQAQVEIGQKINELQAMAAGIAARRAEVEALEREKLQLLTRIAELETERARLRDDRDISLTRLSGVEMVREAVETRLQLAEGLAEQRRLELAEANLARERLSGELAALEAMQTALRQELFAEREKVREARRALEEAKAQLRAAAPEAPAPARVEDNAPATAPGPDHAPATAQDPDSPAGDAAAAPVEAPVEAPAHPADPQPQDAAAAEPASPVAEVMPALPLPESSAPPRRRGPARLPRI